MYVIETFIHSKSAPQFLVDLGFLENRQGQITGAEFKCNFIIDFCSGEEQFVRVIEVSAAN